MSKGLGNITPRKTVTFYQVHITATAEADCSSADDGALFLPPLNTASKRKVGPLISAECTATERVK